MTGRRLRGEVENVQRRSSSVPGPRDTAPDPAAGLSGTLAGVVSGARRRAVRDGDEQVDTAHLLHSLLQEDPRCREVLRPHLARLLGLLVQRSIGYGLRWQGTVEDSGGLPVLGHAGWSPAASLAMDRARERAATRGGTNAPRPADLLAALAADPGCRAVALLRDAGAEPESLPAALDADEPGHREPGHREPGHREADEPGHRQGHEPAHREGDEYVRPLDVSDLRARHREP
ncbi:MULTISPECIES: Clp protease N-terminal domain-containing protein [Streptomyces]|uniref:Clp protease N-terminal domain-containing protein n=1 Tax=Streptomyces evansiae TaxID=3075535 RepID=A0ABU2QY04_9ACTN|nr:MULTISPECIES: Clp protease N-terminal domain-containing protein [unclassified Streptomyces]MDT0408365.1 Clp protease N-terminal domain-containing protein [Streptomyces sp. DSM 41979]MYQ59246.1 Clp protease [Streptomyces sp. SID4926]SCD90874.1 Clp amino terminal domain-containing protein, pathogenicity island component [Streptomyces sp. TverLS-915]SCE56444.1 Clp amino terminal domain-containing protein, pathogenicity island component [Streptomyces sp. DfronAA-171]